MKVTFPHMGNLYIAIKTIFENIGIEVVVPPQISENTLNLGARYSPEFACFPLKVNLGNFIEAIEMGADTIVMAGGNGPCRFGYYSQLQKKILNDLGYDFEFIIIEPPSGGYKEFVEKFMSVLKYGSGNLKDLLYGLWLGYKKMESLDSLEKMANKVRPFEEKKGLTDELLNKFTEKIEDADQLRKVNSYREEGVFELKAFESEPNEEVIRVGIVGEIYMVLESQVNHNVEKTLGELGAVVKRSIYISDWIKEKFFKKRKMAKIVRLADPYLKHPVGGHGVHSIGHSVEYAESGYDGVVQIMPFTCMPEIVAQSVFPYLSRDLDLPSLTLIFDEQTGEAGILTRLEAFVDLIERKKGA